MWGEGQGTKFPALPHCHIPRQLLGPGMKLVISVDVEEEGLFSGEYPRVPAGVANVAQLRRLEFIPLEFGFPLTLLVTYQVAQDPAARQVLAYWRDRYRAEIGAHLHPWNTPPFLDLPYPEPVRSEKLPRPLLKAKIASLGAALKKNLGVSPVSFRMGRFDGSAKVLGLLPEFGFRVDSSMVPLTQKVGGPDFFLIPADPFCFRPGGPQGPPLLEAPLTMVPVWAAAAGLVYRLSQSLPGSWGGRMRAGFPYWGAAGVQPAWYPAASMRGAVRLHRRRGGKVLTIFFHSSELMPRATPQFPTDEAVNRFTQKIRAFLSWLVETGPVQGVTLTELGDEYLGGKE